MADASKTEKPTPKRRQKAREKGQVARSRDLSSVLGMVGVTVFLAWQANAGFGHWNGYVRAVFDLAATDRFESTGPAMFLTAMEVFRWVIPALAAAFTLSLAAGLAQGGFVFAPEALSLNFERLSPAGRLGQIFSLAGLSGVLKSLLPFSAIAYVGVRCFQSHWVQIVHTSTAGMWSFAHLLGEMALEVGWKTGVIMLVWSALDYFITWRKMESDLRMSQQELREEFKESEGNPATKSRIKKIQRQIHRKRMMRAAETATVVITNPTHYAVALKYEPDMPAPVVVAKGRDLLAEKIKEIARWRGIPMMENRPLAQALYRSVEVGQAIPAKLYRAVAEILVFVFRAQAEVRQQEARRRSMNASGQVEGSHER